MRAAKRAGGIVEAAIAYTTSPVHNIDTFVQMANRLKELEEELKRAYARWEELETGRVQAGG